MKKQIFSDKYNIYIEKLQKCKGVKNYKRLVYQFVNDSSFSPQNEDDLRFFEFLIMETDFGKNHIFLYMDQLRTADKRGVEKTILNVVQYMKYLSEMSDAFMHDAIYNSILELGKFSNQTYKAVDCLFLNLDPDSKLKMLNIVQKCFPEVISKSPKMKLYTIFS